MLESRSGSSFWFKEFSFIKGFGFSMSVTAFEHHREWALSAGLAFETNRALIVPCRS